MSRAPRRLFLHVSALSDPEFSVYTSALQDILDGTDNRTEEELENSVLGVQEARAWMKGRFPGLAEIDQILKYFCPSLNQSDALTGGQLFAALRLIMHVQNGSKPSEELVFIQAPLDVIARYQPATTVVQNKNISLDGGAHKSGTNPFRRDSDPPPRHPPLRPSYAARPPVPNVRSGASAPADTLTFRDAPFHSHEPVAERPKPQHQNSEATVPGSSASRGRIPPLPPRKPSHFTGGGLQPPLTPSIIAPQPHTAASSHHAPPPLATKLSSPSILMKQSLQASKTGLSLKRAEQQLEKERVLEVIQSSSSHQRSMDSQGAVSDHEKPRPPSIPPRSVMSLDQVATATIGRRSTPSPTRPPSDRTSSTRSQKKPNLATIQTLESNPSPFSTRPPPTHPDRQQTLPPPLPTTARPNHSPSLSFDSGASPDGGTSSLRRSNTHHTSPSNWSNGSPVPPPRKRRPESMQVGSSGGPPLPPLLNPFANSPVDRSPFRSREPSSEPPDRAPTSQLRKMSLSSNPNFSPLARTQTSGAESEPSFTQTISSSIQKTMGHLQPKLDRARFKAEAGLSRRGFVRHRGPSGGENEQGLMDNDYDELGDDDSGDAIDHRRARSGTGDLRSQPLWRDDSMSNSEEDLWLKNTKAKDKQEDPAANKDFEGWTPL